MIIRFIGHDVLLNDETVTSISYTNGNETNVFKD